MQYNEAYDIFSRARNKERGARLQNNTRLVQRGDCYAVRLHETDIVTIHPDGRYTLNTGGWYTVTTKDRINTYAPVRIYSMQNQWYLSTRDNYNYDKSAPLFVDGCIVDSDGRLLERDLEREAMEIKLNRGLDYLVTRYIKAFVKAIDKGAIKKPGSGDCWFCVMRDAKTGQTLGDASGDNSHILEHLRKLYLVPALLSNAIVTAGYQSPGFMWDLCVNRKDATTTRRILRGYFKRRRAALLKLLRKPFIKIFPPMS